MEHEQGDSGSPMSNEAILRSLFTYHPPRDEGQVAAYGRIREAGFQLAKAILESVPRGADRSTAIRQVREAVMTANAGIANDGLNLLY